MVAFDGRGHKLTLDYAATEESAARVEKALVDVGARGTWVHAPATGQMAGEVLR